MAEAQSAPAGDLSGLRLRERYNTRLGVLRTDYSTWLEHYRELAAQILPRRFRDKRADRNKGSKRNDAIINPTPTLAARICYSGLMAGLTSPARPWHRRGLENLELEAKPRVKLWLHQVEEIERRLLARSNFYNTLAGCIYPDIAVFGTACAIMDDDPKEVWRLYGLPVGEYYLSCSDRGEVDTVFHETGFTTGQIVEKFGLEKCSSVVRGAYERGDYDTYVPVVRVIEPNRDQQQDRIDWRGMPYIGRWYEVAGSDKVEAPFLDEKGFRECPILAPRWDVTNGDTYGRSPAMDVLGDCKQLQKLESRKLELLEKIVRPPVVAPESLRASGASLQPGAVNYVSGGTAGMKMEAIVNPRDSALVSCEGSIRKCEDRINKGMFADLWTMMQNPIGEGRQPDTAEEVRAKKEERLLQLGPALERQDAELLDPALYRLFGIASRKRLYPKPPAELVGQVLRVEYINVMSTAQKLLGIAGIERTVAFTGNLAAVVPEVVDKLDVDKIVEEYGEKAGMAPDLLRPQEAVAKLRAGRRAAAAAAQAPGDANAAKAGAQAAEVLSTTDVNGDTALNRLLQANTGPAATAGFPQDVGRRASA